MRWEKAGLVFSPAGQGGWMNSHAQVPTPLVGDSHIRVYFAARPKQQTSLPGFVDLDIEDPTRVIGIGESPLLQLGKRGTFDEHGVMPSCAIANGDTVYLYYSGWARGVSVPYTNSTGLAVSDDGGTTFHRFADGPILGRSVVDPYSATSPCVLRVGSDWHMWYCSGTAWLEIDGKWEHTYDIKHAQSTNGIDWIPDPRSAVAQRTPLEAITRPYVLREGLRYHMWFCHRGSRGFRDGDGAYRIGYAYSDDLTVWHRDDDQAGITVSREGWDATMVAYPAVVAARDRTLMFYNGNGFGANGFGCAVLA